MTIDPVLEDYGFLWETAPETLRRLAARESVARELCAAWGWDPNATALARTLAVVEFDALLWHEANQRYRARRLAEKDAVDPRDFGPPGTPAPVRKGAPRP